MSPSKRASSMTEVPSWIMLGQREKKWQGGKDWWGTATPHHPLLSTAVEGAC